VRALNVILALVALSGAARAQDPPEPGDDAPSPHASRTLKGHTFLYPATFDSAFLGWQLVFQQGLESTHVSDLPYGSLGYVNLSSLSAVERLQFDAVFPGDRFGLSVIGFADASLGIDGTTILVKGGAYDFGGTANFVARAYRSDTSGTQITARAGGSVHDGQFLNVANALQAAVSAPGTTADQAANGSVLALLLQPTWGYWVGASINGAQTICPSLGVQGSLALRHSWNRLPPSAGGSSIEAWQPGVGIAGTYDFAPLGFAMATMVEYSGMLATSRNKSGADNTSVLSLGLYYSGRPTFQLGVVGSRTWGPPFAASEGFSGRVPTVLSGLLVIHYVWSEEK
jgi:hypothetical protein